MPDKCVPKVSIVLLNYNGSKDTISCIKSLCDITYKNYYIIIVDNSSTDDSMNSLRNHLLSLSAETTVFLSPNEAMEASSVQTKFTLLQTGRNGGCGYGNNVGIKYALNNGASYVLTINNDTVVDPVFLGPMVDMCQNDKRIGIVSGKIYFYDRPDVIWFNGGVFNSYTSKLEHTNFNEKDVGQYPPKIITFISGCLWLIPGDVFEKIGFINEEYFMYVEDLEYSQRVLNRGYALKICPESRIWHKVGGSSDNRFSAYWTSRNTYKFIRSERENVNQLFSCMYLLFFKSFRFMLKGEYKVLWSHLLGIRDAIQSIK